MLLQPLNRVAWLTGKLQGAGKSLVGDATRLKSRAGKKFSLQPRPTVAGWICLCHGVAGVFMAGGHCGSPTRSERIVICAVLSNSLSSGYSRYVIASKASPSTFIELDIQTAHVSRLRIAGLRIVLFISWCCPTVPSRTPNTVRLLITSSV